MTPTGGIVSDAPAGMVRCLICGDRVDGHRHCLITEMTVDEQDDALRLMERQQAMMGEQDQPGDEQDV